MFDKLQYIELSGQSIPYKCDLFVLEKIQDKYGSLSEYENRLSGFTPSKDENGENIRNEKGYLVGTSEQPDISVLNDTLIWMVEEGLEIEREAGKETVSITNRGLIRMVDMSPRELSEILHEEFNRCFKRKNVKTMQSKEKNKKKQA